MEIRDATREAFGPIEDTFDPATFFDFIPPGAGGRNTIVQALKPGVPVPEGARTPTGEPDLTSADFGLGPGSSVPAFPSQVFAPTDPRGLRNNNPGNIRRDDTEWMGLHTAGHQMDPSFFQFIRMEFGIRAMTRIFRIYKKNHGIDSLTKLSHRWAPASDGNDPVQHARNIAAHSRGNVTGIETAIDLDDREILFGVVRGVMVAENGRKAETVSDEEVREGIELERTA